MRLVLRYTPLFVMLVLSATSAFALRNPDAGRFSPILIQDPASSVGIVAESPESVPGFESEARAWQEFRSAHGGAWDVRIDRRSGAPLLVQGQGIRWFDPTSETPGLDALAARAVAFVREHAGLFKVDPAELVLNRAASAAIDRDRQLLVFDRAIDGRAVEGNRFILWIVRGNLVSFGATRWGAVGNVPAPVYSADTAREVLWSYMNLTSRDRVTETESGSPVLVPTQAGSSGSGPYLGRPGEGVAHRLAWRFTLRVEGERGTWVGKVDAATGEVISFEDDNRYGQAKGGVYPVSDDGICPDGCEQTGYPMPYADVSIDGTPQTANDMGIFSCSPAGGTATATLAGPYVRVADLCGAVNESTICDSDLDLKQGPGTDCQVPAGSSAGNTHSARSSFYHLNRVMEKGRAWLPSNTWLRSQLVDNLNINSTCNAYWDGAVNFYRSGGGCRNTGEIAGVFVHEWGHGIDQNDGGGYDNPSEAYADVVAFFQTHTSCIGRGFFMSGNCDGYGNACLNCTGIRDQDWDTRASHTPSTPAGFIQNNCGSGSGPCGKETHCEGYLAGETVWDLAVRDLPAAGLDTATAWQVADRLFYQSRQGSGGNAYNCALPSSDGCIVGGWYNTFRTIDDDDGNLANGTPHGAAIFAAFDRHKIACGLATDASNQSFAACAPPAAPVMTAAAGSNAVHLSWNAVPGAVRYVILRNDIGCSAGHTRIATVDAPATTYDDTDLPNAFNVYYAVQSEGAVSSCLSALSACQGVAPLPSKGEVRLDRGSYACSDTIQVKVLDLNLNRNSSAVETIAVTVSSTTEPTPEILTLTETGVATAQFVGSIATSGSSAVPGDGVLQVANGDNLTVTYRDADDGTGLPAIVFKTVKADCAGPVITDVRAANITDYNAAVLWTTQEAASSKVEWGTSPSSLTNVVTDTSLVTAHSVTIGSFAECGRIYFRVSSTDGNGNTSTAGAGTPFALNGQTIPGLFKDQFESNTGWTLEGEWQIGAPQGKGQTDPTTAFAGSQVLGHDLTGLGHSPGNYEAGSNQRAASPVINASSLVGGRLVFRRWLNSFNNAIAHVEVKKNGTWYSVWTSPQFFGVSEGAWSLQTIDISQYADGNSSLQIGFRQTGGTAGNQRGGWNVDRLVVKSASDPDAVACGGCGGAPSFGGATSATDIAPCADTGIRVEWQQAASWGTGGTGTYSVYRDTIPNFTPSSANRIATGVAGTSYVDAVAPNGVTLYYLVRAENNETCSSGPANGGVTETNTVYASARDETTQAAPGAVASMTAAAINAAHVRLSWGAPAGAAKYRVFRADVPQGPFTRIGEVTGTLYEDRDEMASGVSRFYVVRAVDACGNEGL
jgi:hypothetical protein